MENPRDDARTAAQKPVPQAVAAIQAILPGLAAKNRQAAEYFLSHPDHVAFLSLRKIALAARVSTSIIMKLLRDLGYDSYAVFKADFQQWVTGRYTYFTSAAEEASRKKHADNSIIAKIGGNDIENIQRTMQAVSDSDLRAASRAIVSARKVFIMGMRGASCIATYLAYQLGFVRNEVILVDDCNQSLVDRVADFSADDVLIAVSFFPNSANTVKAVQQAALKGTYVIAITERENSPVSVEHGQSLLFSVESDWIYNSITAGFVIVQTLVVEALALSGDAALQRIKERDKLLRAFSIFGQ